LYDHRTLAKKKNTAADTISKIKALRSGELSPEQLIEGILKGDKAVLAKAITLIESSNPSHFEKANSLIEKCLSIPNKSIRMGITGVPGVGKSSFIEALGTTLTQREKKVAVLAVDPSSSLTKGSILGDKTRMQALSNDPNAFIRPSPSGTSLGGVTQKTRETIILCEAAGHDVILVETVGVGQSETAVHSMVDFFLLLKLSGAGDELQGIKRGIMEMADAIAINKADGDNVQKAQRALVEFNRALHLYPPKENGWVPKVTKCSSTENRGISELWELVEGFVRDTRENGFFDENRRKQNRNWFLQSVDLHIRQFFKQQASFNKNMEELIVEVEQGRISPFYAAKKLVEGIGGNFN